MQSTTDGHWKPVAYISRAMTETEQCYAQVEKEALVVTWACERLSHYLIGKNFHIETDHKPLVSLLGNKNLNALPPRIQRLCMRLLRFKYTISHVPGKSLVVADTLSRTPVTKHISEHDNRQNEEIELYVNSVLSEVPASDKRLEEIRERQREDEVCRQMVTYCKDGWPERASCPEALKAYWSERNEITLVKGILMKGCRIIIPSVMHLEILVLFPSFCDTKGLGKTRDGQNVTTITEASRICHVAVTSSGFSRIIARPSRIFNENLGFQRRKQFSSSVTDYR